MLFSVISSESEKSSADGTSQKVDVPDVLSIFVIRLHEHRCLAHFLGYSEHFFVIPSESEESIHTLFVIPKCSKESSIGCFASLSMTEQCHSERSEESSAWMLRHRGYNLIAISTSKTQF